MEVNLENVERVAALRGGLKYVDWVLPDFHGLDIIYEVHDSSYIDFLKNGFSDWAKVPHAGVEMRASVHPNRHMARMPQDVLGRAGFYIADTGTVLMAESWRGILASAQTAIHAAKLVSESGGSAYALCRPPGHHACTDMAGGFCYLNNAALAVLQLQRKSKLRRIAVLDVDVHHGNGTQQIFYERDDVLTVSVHGDPSVLYPYYSGYTDEVGVLAGAGFNLNIPIQLGGGDDAYVDAVEQALLRIESYCPDALVVSLGLDFSEDDPFHCMAVTPRGFERVGLRVGQLKLPTVLVQEGGYVSATLGQNLNAFLSGYAAC